ncbi:MAG: endolytic transglycosylase MltG [Acidimicrobiales bacterium]
MAFMLTRPLGRAIAGLIAVVIIGLGWFTLQVYPVGGSGKEVIVTVHPGDSIALIAGELHTKGVISSAFAFRLDALIFGAPIVVPGSYELKQGSSFSQVRSILGAVPNVHVVVVNPGLTLHEVALNVAQDTNNAFGVKFLADATAAAATSAYHPNGSLEGLIGPGQYLISSKESPAQLLEAMERSFDREATRAGFTPTTSISGLNAYQLLTAASIVEKEGYYAFNMPKVARVIYNRLARGSALQMDATVLYYFQQDGGTVTHAMLQTATPYNTYLNAGLTPTPICTVSSTALAAVLHAPPGPWLYFTVVDKKGTEAFSTTFAQQLANERLAASRGVG